MQKLKRWWFWLRNKKFGFEFTVQSPAFVTPQKAVCPAFISKVCKYKPIVWHSSDKKTIKIKPIVLTRKARGMARSVTSDVNRADFLAEATYNCHENIAQIYDVLKDDLENHFENMRVAYDVFSVSKQFGDDIKKLSAELADLITSGASPEAIKSKRAELNGMKAMKVEHDKNFLVTIQKQRGVGDNITDNIKLRMDASLIAIRDVKLFYRDLWRAMQALPLFPDELKFDSIKDESELIDAVFEEGILGALRVFGMTRDSHNRTFKKKTVDIGGEGDGGSS